VNKDIMERLHESARSAWDLATHTGIRRWEFFAKASRREELHFGISPPVLRTLSMETGVAMRLFSSGEHGFGTASGLDIDAARAAITGARNSLYPIAFDPLPPFHDLSTRDNVPPPPPLPDISWPRETAAELTRAILQETGDAVLVREIIFQQAYLGWLLATGEGFTAARENTIVSITVLLSNTNGSPWHHQEWFWIPDAEKFDSRAAAFRIAARSLLPALPCDSREGLFDVLLHPEMSAHLAAALAPLFLPGADDMLQGVLDRQGRLAPSCINLIEDQGNPNSPTFAPCDGEGVATVPHLLLDQGIPRHRPCSFFQARLYGDPPRGGAVRISYRDRPKGGFSGLLLNSRSPLDPEDLVPTQGISLYLNRPLELPELDTVRDSLTLRASGVWLVDGQPRFSQPDIRITGSLTGFLRRIEAVGKDMEWHQTSSGFVSAPSILVRCQRVS